jgi:2,3-bisphosphoglycerate-independent phosphoglycerate mutase
LHSYRRIPEDKIEIEICTIVPDGAADKPLEIFGGKTVIEAADIPNIDKIAIDGRQGMVHTVPKGLQPGSDVAMMSLLVTTLKKIIPACPD